ncbi:YafY family protein [Sebaldella sp. S0638]|uniref:helix-turn-helix transcriptional regulator n=1 Tax=Sebaldella sp. S0638 TaxID=2957809 RepID=UPI0020A041E3|nr:YafY family protein [Sebaldella sp. S0638]MCP1224020.1 YafY family transcriptional regulator [Sebaldella sp. S0638]
MKTDRILNILYYLNRYKKVSAKRLAEEFEVSQRTIYRDLDILESMGIPIERKMGFEGGISIIENFKLENINFSKSELTRIISILNNYYYKDSKTKLLIEKFKNIISDKEMEEQRKLDYFKIEEGYLMHKREKENITSLKKAIENKNIIDVKYISGENVISQRKLEPYIILIKGNSVYLFANCLLREELRVFRVSRILEIEITNGKFTENPEITEKIYSQKEFFNDCMNDEVILKYKKNFFEIAKFFLNNYKVLDIKEWEKKYNNVYEKEHIIIKLNWRIDKWFLEFILSLGDNVEVLEPEELRSEIMERVKNMYMMYMREDK